MPVDRDIRRRHGGFHISARLLLPSTETRGPGCQRRSIPFRSVYNISYSECAHSPSFCATVRVLMDIIWLFHRLDPGCIGGPLGLSLDTREVGRVTIVRCTGRIVAGAESESLRAHVDWLLRDRRSIVLHMGEVGFIDSSGLGTMVRSLTSIRRAHGDLKLCNVTEPVRKVLEMPRLTQVFDAHESEEKAVAAFYRTLAPAETPVSTGHSILCVDYNCDVLAYLRELLRRAGYNVQSSSHLSDALILM